MSDDPKHSLQIGSVYREFGHMGRKEVNTTYTLEVEKTHSMGDKMIVLITRTTTRPDSLDQPEKRETSTGRREIKVQDLIDFIKANGSIPK